MKNEEKNMEITIKGYIGTTKRIHFFIPSLPKVSIVVLSVGQVFAALLSGKGVSFPREPDGLRDWETSDRSSITLTKRACCHIMGLLDIHHDCNNHMHIVNISFTLLSISWFSIAVLFVIHSYK